MAYEVGGGIEAAAPGVVVEHDGLGLVPGLKGLVHEVLGEQNGIGDLDGFMFLAGAQVDEADPAMLALQILQGLWRDHESGVFFMAFLNVRDGLRDGHVLIAGTNLGQSLFRAESATAAPADVIAGEESPLSAREPLQHLGHGSVWLKGRECFCGSHGDRVTTVGGRETAKFVCASPGKAVNSPFYDFMTEREPRIYVLPTMMTAGNILAGFVAILQIFQGREGAVSEHYYYAILAILAACLFDVLDGRLARLGGQESPFGRELDSLADIVSFGIAPALLVHDIVLQSIEKPAGLGYLIAAAYLVCGAMRLARFNCIAAAETEDSPASKNFQGCPIPAAAGVISSLTLLLLWLEGTDKEVGGPWRYGLALLMVLLSYLMVSKLEYPSFKSVNWRTRRSFQWVIVSILVAAFTVKNWQWMPSVLFVSYLLYGLFRPWVSRKWRQQIEIEREDNGDAPGSETEETVGEADLKEPEPESDADPASQI